LICQLHFDYIYQNRKKQQFVNFFYERSEEVCIAICNFEGQDLVTCWKKLY